jgi:hypothetical protein
MGIKLNASARLLPIVASNREGADYNSINFPELQEHFFSFLSLVDVSG